MGKNKDSYPDYCNFDRTFKGYLVDVLLGFPIDKVLMLVAVIATVYSAYDYIVKMAMLSARQGK